MSSLPRTLAVALGLTVLVAPTPARERPLVSGALRPVLLDDDDVVVTATRNPASPDDVPYNAAFLGAGVIQDGPDARSLPNALARVPGVLLQKTGPGQSSPFLRGWTGFHTLWLVDGVRLNNSTWRSGPNQYTSTVDNWSVSGLDVVLGPGSVLWGSDAVGGVVTARTAPVPVEDGWSAFWGGRYSTAERSLANRLEVQGGQADAFGLRVGVTEKSFGNLTAGAGSRELPGTAYDERDADLRLDVPLDDGLDLTVVGQRVRQRNVPRVHKTVEAVPFHGSSVGSELQRDLDQERDLAYARLRFEDEAALYDEGSVTLSWQRNEEEQDRIRTNGPRRDIRGFEVDTVGVSTQFVKDADHGVVTWGLEAYHDEVDSFRRDFVAGVPQGPTIQGSLADDASYDLLGVFIQDELVNDDGDVETTLGARWQYAAAEADRIDNPNVAGSDPTTPGNVLTLDESWSTFVGSARTRFVLDEHDSVWVGASQGFRAPSLSDLTADLEDSGVETPTPDLDPEEFLTVEVGARTGGEGWSGQVVVHHSWIDDLIVRSPTGQVVGGTPVFQKDNVGDGRTYGVELDAEVQLSEPAPDEATWTCYGGAAWMATKVDQFRANGVEISRPLGRTLPLNGHLGVRRVAADGSWFVEADVLASDQADKLSLRDKADTERIPPGGTPGWGVVGVRGRAQIDANSSVGVGLENLFNKDYRVHGSGQNEPGRSLVVTWRVRT